MTAQSKTMILRDGRNEAQTTLSHLNANRITAIVGSQQRAFSEEKGFIILLKCKEFEEFDKVSAHIAAHTDAIKRQGSSRNLSKFVFVIIQILITPEHV